MRKFTVLMGFLIFAVFAVVPAPTEAWELYDDFNDGYLDISKWIYGPDLRGFERGGEVVLSVTQPAGVDETDPQVWFLNNAGIYGVKADLRLLSTSTEPDACIKMTAYFGGIWEGEIYLGKWPDGTLNIHASVEDDDDGSVRLNSVPANFDQTYTVAMVFSGSTIQFYVNDILLDTFNGQGGLAPASFVVDGINFETRTFATGSFVDGRVDNVYVATTETLPLTSRPQVAAGGEHTVGLMSDGTVAAAGDNTSGQLNVGGWTGIVQVAAGGAHTVGLETDGTLEAVGDNTFGQLDVSGWTGINQIATGDAFTVGLVSDGTVTATGNNTAGQLGVGGWTGIVQVTAGDAHTVGLMSGGTVAAAGDNTSGQLNVSGWTGIIQIAAGDAHTVGLMSDGTVVAVGDNTFGQLNVTGWTDIIQVAAGSDHTVGLRSDGTVVAVGDNSSGQTNVSEGTGIVQVAAGTLHTVGLTAFGTVVGVGDNTSGQLDVTGFILSGCDTDGDGLVDRLEIVTGTHPLDADTDDDGIQDGTETGVTTPVADPDGDGPAVGTDTGIFIPDSDSETTTNPLDADSDDDGLTDGEEDINHNGTVDSGETDPMDPPLAGWQLYDDFSSGIVDTNKWDIWSNSDFCGITVEGEEMKFACYDGGDPEKRANAVLINIPGAIYAIRATVRVSSASGDIRLRLVGSNGQIEDIAEHESQIYVQPGRDRVQYWAGNFDPVTEENTDLWYKNHYVLPERFEDTFTITKYFFPNHVKYAVEGMTDIECSLETNYDDDIFFDRKFSIKSSDGNGYGVFYIDDVYVLREAPELPGSDCRYCSTIPSRPTQIGFVRNNASGTKTFVLDKNHNAAWDSGIDLVASFGEATDTAVVGDWTGDAVENIGLVRHLPNASKKWIFDLNNNIQWDSGTDLSGFFGSATDTQVIGDWNGDGQDDIALVRHLPNGSKKFIFDMNNNLQWDSGIDYTGFFGSDTDTAIVGDWNGDGNDEIGVVRDKADGSKVWILDMNGNAAWDSGTDLVASLGESTDTHIVGDWNGDGTDDIGLVRHLPNGSKKWIFDMNNNLQWDSGTDLSGFFGSDTDAQVIGDWNGDGKDDIALIRHLPNDSKKWIFDMNNNLQWDSGVDMTGFFGSASDSEIVGRW